MSTNYLVCTFFTFHLVPLLQLIHVIFTESRRHGRNVFQKQITKMMKSLRLKLLSIKHQWLRIGSLNHLPFENKWQKGTSVCSNGAHFLIPARGHVITTVKLCSNKPLYKKEYRITFKLFSLYLQDAIVKSCTSFAPWLTS